jgi:NADH-ubiquinone oxidoreductase chain 5
MSLLILILPLLSFLFAIYGGHLFGPGIKFVCSACIGLTCFFLIYKYVYLILNGGTFDLILNQWLASDFVLVKYTFIFSRFTVTLLLIITFISFLVHMYSTEYMAQDPHYTRFLGMLSGFTWLMMILVSADNVVMLMWGWEGVGVSSYLLINYWFVRIQASKAAIKAMLMNRIGDYFLIISLFVIFDAFSTFEIPVLQYLSPFLINYTVTIFSSVIYLVDFLCSLLILACMGKSAQFGLHTWLPDAMEGPTPVSALLHAATMVTAGVFVLSRFSFFFELSPFALKFIILVGSTTAFFGGAVGLFQNDLKKIIAFSTCSQLGYMVLAAGLSNYELSIFHLSNHAFFKALLFLCAGAIVHSGGTDEQDIRKMGGLKNLLPLVYTCMLIGSLALMGFPFLSGYYSKELILGVSYLNHSAFGYYAFFLGTLGALCTAIYSTRLIVLVFLASANGFKKPILNAHEPNWPMRFPLILLTLLTIFIGYFSKDLFIGFGTDFWVNSIFLQPSHYTLIDVEFIPVFYKLLPFLLTLFGSYFTYYVYTSQINLYFVRKHSIIYQNIYTFLIKKWFIDRLYNQVIVQNLLTFSYFFSYKFIDRQLLEYFGPTFFSNFFFMFSNNVKVIQTGYIFQYLAIMFFFINLLIIFI